MEHGAEVGEEIEGVVSEGIEVSGGEERSLEELLSRSSGARWCFLCHFGALLPGSTRFT